MSEDNKDIDAMLTAAIADGRKNGKNTTLYSEAVGEIRRLRKVERAAIEYCDVMNQVAERPRPDDNQRIAKAGMKLVQALASGEESK